MAHLKQNWLHTKLDHATFSSLNSLKSSQEMRSNAKEIKKLSQGQEFPLGNTAIKSECKAKYKRAQEKTKQQKNVKIMNIQPTSPQL